MNQIRTLLFLLGIPLAMILIGDLVAHEAGVCVAIILTVLMYLSAWSANGALPRLYNARETTLDDLPKLKTIVTALAQSTNLAIPKIYLINDDAPNAFAIGRNKNQAGLVITTGLLDALNEDELKAVLSHEFSHIQQQDTLIAGISAVVAGFFTGLANTTIWKKIINEKSKAEDKINPTLMRIFAPIASVLIKLAVSPAKEFLADHAGAKLCGNPQALASALEKIEKSKEKMVFSKAELLPTTAHLFFVNPLQPTGTASLFDIQPSTANRIRQLESMQ